MTSIKIPYKPRPLQKKLHEELAKTRWSVLVMHRRFGKTVMAINHLLRDALTSEKTNPRFAYIAPSYKQAKSVAWDYLKQFSEKIPLVRFHETELRADFPNGARIQLLGAENYDSLRGIYLDGCVIDEMADMPESLFPTIIRPALSDRKGWCSFIGTPRGMNAFYVLYEAALDQDDWFVSVMKASETGILDQDELDGAKSMMSNDQYDQEFECSWVANVPGSVYGKELQQLSEAGNVSDFPYDPSNRVDTHWDLCIGDATAIWFTQSVGSSIHVIDYYEQRGEGLNHFAEILNKRGYVYGTHNAPHDIDVRELGTGKSRKETAYDLGINFRVVPKLPIEDGIHAAKMMIPRCRFDRDMCQAGLEALRHYHRAYNERTRTFRATPVHDWSSHAADAFRYLAVGIRDFRDQDRPMQMTADNDYNPLARAS